MRGSKPSTSTSSATRGPQRVGSNDGADRFTEVHGGVAGSSVGNVGMVVGRGTVGVVVGRVGSVRLVGGGVGTVRLVGGGRFGPARGGGGRVVTVPEGVGRPGGVDTVSVVDGAAGSLRVAGGRVGTVRMVVGTVRVVGGVEPDVLDGGEVGARERVVEGDGWEVLVAPPPRLVPSGDGPTPLTGGALDGGDLAPSDPWLDPWPAGPPPAEEGSETPTHEAARDNCL